MLGVAGGALALSGCPGASLDTSPPLDAGADVGISDVTTAVIGARGGSLESADGGLLVEVPPGALDGATEIRVRVEPSVTADERSARYVLEPDGQAFSTPVRLRFRSTTPTDGHSLVAVRSVEDAYEVLPTWNIDGETVGETSHFSTYLVLQYPNGSETNVVACGDACPVPYMTLSRSCRTGSNDCRTDCLLPTPTFGTSVQCDAGGAPVPCPPGYQDVGRGTASACDPERCDAPTASESNLTYCFRTCGNRRIDRAAGESCDGDAIDCSELNRGSGRAACDPTFCTADVSECEFTGATPAVAVESLFMQGFTSCAVQRDGTLSCWGAYPEPTTGMVEVSAVPSIVPVPPVLHVAGGAMQGTRFLCAVMQDRTVDCWGEVFATALFQPRRTLAGLSGVTDIGGDGVSFCALARGDVYCWSPDPSGYFPATPTSITDAVETTFVSIDDLGVCGIDSEANVYCWGNDPTVPGYVPPQRMDSMSGARDVAANSPFNACAVIGSGRIVCSERLGATFAGLDRVSDAVTVSLGGSYACALRANDEVTCFGWGERTPELPSVRFEGVRATVSGSSAVCAALADGRAACWGAANGGALGTGASEGFFPSPTYVLTPDEE